MQYTKNFSNLFALLVGLLLITLIGSAYIKSEVLTIIYATEFDIENICNTQNKINRLKYFKLIDYQRYKENAVVYCIYIKPEDNLRLRLFLENEKWLVEYPTKMQESNSFFWPIYY